MRVEQIAMVCHAANRAFCQSIGDYSQLEWSEAAQWQRDSWVAGVHFALGHPEATAESQHQAWSADKVRDGWVYGPLKDSVAKTHPCLVPYEEFPVEQQRKDALFQAIVKALK